MKTFTPSQFENQFGTPIEKVFPLEFKEYTVREVLESDDLMHTTGEYGRALKDNINYFYFQLTVRWWFSSDPKAPRDITTLQGKILGVKIYDDIDEYESERT